MAKKQYFLDRFSPTVRDIQTDHVGRYSDIASCHT
jgi:hypothetical protein